MDKLTREQWEHEFRKQYPEHEPTFDAEEVRKAFVHACRAVIKASDTADRKLSKMYENAIVINVAERAWQQWRDECLSRFEALYEQDRWRAVMALNNGDLLID